LLARWAGIVWLAAKILAWIRILPLPSTRRRRLPGRHQLELDGLGSRRCGPWRRARGTQVPGRAGAGQAARAARPHGARSRFRDLELEVALAATTGWRCQMHPRTDRRELLDHAEKTRDEPDIVTSLPPTGARKRTPVLPLTPTLRRLPRP
jgi:hypothetical protein